MSDFVVFCYFLYSGYLFAHVITVYTLELRIHGIFWALHLKCSTSERNWVCLICNSSLYRPCIPQYQCFGLGFFDHTNIVNSVSKSFTSIYIQNILFFSFLSVGWFYFLAHYFVEGIPFLNFLLCLGVYSFTS